MNRYAPRRAVVLSELLADDAPAERTSVSRRRVEMVESVEEARTASKDVAAAEHREQELRDVGEALEQISEIVHGAIADDPEEDVADSTELVTREAADRELRRVGERLPALTSTESVGSPRERVMLTMESISSAIVRIIEAIKNAIKAVIETITRFFERYIGALETSKALAKELSADIKTLTWDKLVDTKSSYASKIAVGDKLPDTWITDTLDYINSVSKADGEMFDLTYGISEMFTAEYEKSMKSKEHALDLVKYGKAFEGYFGGLNKKLAGIALTPSKTGKAEGEKGGITPITSGILPGGKVLVHREPTPGLDATTYFVNATGVMGPNMVTIESEKEFKAAVLPAPTKSTLISTVDSLPALVQEIITAKKTRHDNATKLSKAALGFLTKGTMTDFDNAPTNVRAGLKMYGVLAKHSLVIAKPLEQYLLFLLPAYLHALSDVVDAHR
jgi:hypothetical protein